MLGDHPVELKATYSDGTVRYGKFVFVVEPSVATLVDPTYETKTIELPRESDKPVTLAAPSLDGYTAMFVAGPYFPEWATLNTDGSIVLNPPADLPEGPFKFNVWVWYNLDSSEELVPVEVKLVHRAPEPEETPVVTPEETSEGSSVDANCVAVAAAAGIPALLLIPFALGIELDIPGVAPLTRDLQPRLTQANTELQKALGIHNPQLAQIARDFNAQVNSVVHSREVRRAAGAVAALVLAGAVAGACAPGGGSSTSSAS
ncbi:hypothetical protein [Corynebacterium sp.]|uniref:hypothetical protein n=1 Tax=Corynebacterium sp. TaxID=1720 RepID=UPI002A90CA8B|nr:hypothetical protein [Corynebacterium sp.]MDY5785083.1 hypothetical protein [Corynebacterium sp.]